MKNVHFIKNIFYFFLEKKKMKSFMMCLILMVSLSAQQNQSIQLSSKKEKAITLDQLIEYCFPYLMNHKSWIWKFFFETKTMRDLCSPLLYKDNNSILRDKQGKKVLRKLLLSSLSMHGNHKLRNWLLQKKDFEIIFD